MTSGGVDPGSGATADPWWGGMLGRTTAEAFVSSIDEGEETT